MAIFFHVWTVDNRLSHCPCSLESRNYHPDVLFIEKMCAQFQTQTSIFGDQETNMFNPLWRLAPIS
jgi:hypothetical protein